LLWSPHLSDILVADSADLLNVGGALGDVLQGVSGQLKLILDVGRGDDLNTRLGGNTAHDLLAKEVSDLDFVQIGLRVLLNVDVDGKVSVDVAHLVQETAGNTNDQVVDEGTDSTEGSNALANAMVELDGDGGLVGTAKGDSNVRKVLGQLASGTLDGYDPGANADGHYIVIQSALYHQEKAFPLKKKPQ
jgi:hypothetical protein